MMKNLLYPQLAISGISKNKRLYLPYILTSAGMTMMFYIISFLANGDTLNSFIGGDTMKQTLTFGFIVIAVFSLIFLFYTNSFLIKRRKKEFGLYNILGMDKKNLAKVLFWESLIISVISIASGLLCGIIFSKLAELLMVNIMHVASDFSFNIEWTSVGQTAAVFFVIFALIMLNTMSQVSLSNPIDLLRSENAGEKPPKANWILAIAGVIIMGAAYYIAVSIKEPIQAILWFFVAVVMVIVATYLVFISGSVVFCKMLQKNKNYYYKTNHFVSVSSMVYRMKRNGAGLASICILCTMVLVMVSSTVCLYMGAEDSLKKQYPRDVMVNIIVKDMADFESDRVTSIENSANAAAVEHKKVPRNVLTYRTANFLCNISGNKVITTSMTDYTNSRSIFFIPLSAYNNLMDSNETLEDGEALIFSTVNTRYKESDIEFENGLKLRIKDTVDDFVDIVPVSMNPLYIIVSDFEKTVEPFMQQANYKGDQLVTLFQFYGYNLECDDEIQNKIVNSLSEQMTNQYGEAEDISVKISGIATEREDFYGLYGGLFFLGILLGIVFIFAAVLIIYYKQISEGYEDQSRFEIMQKVGMNKKEIKKSINSQVLTVFFLPIIMSAVHLGFAFPMIYKMLLLFSISNLTFLILITLACFAVFTLLYIIVYRLTSKAYYSIVSGAKD